MKFVIAVLTVIAAYLIGSINFAVIFTNLFNKTDVRNYGSGNAGATNVMRVSGAKAGTLTFICDALKGAVACILGLIVFKYALYTPEMPYFNHIYGQFACAFGCMVGHCWPVFFQFRGGKAAATSVGIFAVCCPPAIVLGLIGFIICMITAKMVSLGSLVATVIVVIVTVVYAHLGLLGNVNPWVISAIMLVCGFIVFYRHKENIVRLINGTEKRFSIKKDK